MYGCETFDNVYVGSAFHQLDRRRAELTGGVDRLLPLKKHERRQLVAATSWRLADPERALYRSGVCVLALSLATTLVVVSFDFALYWILAGVVDPAAGAPRGARRRREAADGPGAAGALAGDRRPGTERAVSGDGVVVNLLDVFVRGFEPHWMRPAGVDEELRSLGCLPTADAPSVAVLVALVIIYVAFFLVVLLKAYLHRARVRYVLLLLCKKGKGSPHSITELIPVLGSHMQLCTLLRTVNHASTPPLSFYRLDALPAAQPTASKHRRHILFPVVQK